MGVMAKEVVAGKSAAVESTVGWLRFLSRTA